MSRCKIKQHAYNMKRRDKQRDYFKEYDKKNRKRLYEKYKERMKSLIYIAKHKVRYAVAHAIRDGRLIRKTCEVCDNKAHAHHDDYNKTFEVRWLCRKHHVEWHQTNKAIEPHNLLTQKGLVR